MSGSTIGGIAGAAVGYYVSGGSAQGAQIGWMVGSAVGGAVDPTVIKGPRLTDAQQQTTMEGAPRTIGYGTFVAAGCIIHRGPLVEHSHKDSGKGSGTVQKTYTYSRTFAIGIGEPIDGISRIWEDDKLVVDWRNPADWPEAAAAIRAMAGDSAKFMSNVKVYTGSETQEPDPSLEALPADYQGGIGNVCAHRGTSYVVFTDKDLTQRGGSIAQYRFECVKGGTTAMTQNVVPWVTGNAGAISGSVNSLAVSGLTCLIVGDHGFVEQTTDGGRTWQAATLPPGWTTSDAILGVWHLEDTSNTAGNWYIAKLNKVAVSYDGGGSFTDYLTPVHSIAGGRGVWAVGGIPYAAAASTTDTLIFQPMSLGGTDLSMGGWYGLPTAVAQLGGSTFVGTGQGYILSGAGTVLYHNASVGITQFAADGSGAVMIAALTGGGYLRSVDGGVTWTLFSSGAIRGVCYARGKFYFAGTTAIYSSPDGVTLTPVDTSFSGNTLSSYIDTDGYSVIANTQGGAGGVLTAILPSAYVLPDFASGWHIDNTGNVVGDTTYSVSRSSAVTADIVSDIASRVGITSAQIDVTQIPDTVRGFTIGDPNIRAKEAVAELQKGLFFDWAEWGDYPDEFTKLRAIKRGAAAVLTLDDNDLVDNPDDEETRPQPVEFYRKVNLYTSDVDSDYNPTKQTATRRTENVKAIGEANVTISLVTTRAEAAPMADKMLKVMWEEAIDKMTREWPEKFSKYVPSDCFIYNEKRWRIKKASLVDGSTTIECVRDRASAYLSVATPGDAPLPTLPPTTSLRGPVMFAALNLQRLRTQDDSPGMYVFTCGLLDGYQGCDLELSTDDGLTFRSVADITEESTMGVLDAACDSGAADLIVAKLYHRHEIDSVTDAQIASRLNAWAIATNTVAETGQSKTAEETATAGTYNLTDNTRGELGTIAAAHATGDPFVLLSGPMTFVKLDVSLAGQVLTFRPVSKGTAPANNRTYRVVFDPQFATASTVAFYSNAAGEKYIDASGAFYYEET